MAATLPTEITQSILLFTDPDTYWAARLACSSWRHAASSSFMLREALKRTPTPLPSDDVMTEEDWNALYNQIVHTNLLGRRNCIRKRVSERKRPKKCTYSTVLGASGDGAKLASLNGSRVVLYNVDEDTNELEFNLAQSLYPLWTTMSRSMVEGRMNWLSMGQHYSKYHIALSNRGSLIAVALGRSIHIYDLENLNNPDSPVEYVLGDNDSVIVPPGVSGYEEARGVIESLEFAEDDTLLRVTIGKEPNTNRQTRVRYLGNPTPVWGSNPTQSGVGGLHYWRENIHNIYLDSVALAVTLRDDNKTSFQGLRLLPQSLCKGWSKVPGRFFIAALQNTGVNCYCIAFVSDSDHRVSVWRQLPSRKDRTSDSWNNLFENPPEEPAVGLSTSDAAVVARNREMAKERWNPVNTPNVTTMHQLLALSDDGKLLVIYEPGAGHSYSFSNGGALYVYSLELGSPVFKQEAGMENNAQANEQSQQAQQQEQQPFSASGVSPSIQPWSFLLDIVNVDIESLRVVRKDQSSGNSPSDARKVYKIRAETAHEVMEWRLA